MFGTVEKGPKNTRFRLEFRLNNDCEIFEVLLIPNFQLVRYPRTYSHALDHLTQKIEKRVNDRQPVWRQ